jgi:molecular chaperone GrpE (heat shock protein)
MSANATEEPIKLTDDGKYVIMPVNVFRNREINLLKLEDKVQVLEKALAEERQAYDEWQAEFDQLAEALNAEREAYHQLEMANLKDKFTWGLGGILIGAVIALAVD